IDGVGKTVRIDAEAVVDFLGNALSGGAVPVCQLEAKARAAGLLGDKQQIQHAKKFISAKKSLGIKSTRNGFGAGGKWAWFLPPEHRSPGAEPAIAGAESYDVPFAAVEPKHTALELEGHGIPLHWLEGVARLDCQRPPSDVPQHRWRQFVDDCKNFLTTYRDLARRAATLGWDLCDFFGCAPTRPFDHLGTAGLLSTLTDAKLV